uniref:Transcription factor LBX1 n=1 Tax=Panthera tigris altaica TaxID=74533 RepID=A0A8C9KNA9_PANTA
RACLEDNSAALEELRKNPILTIPASEHLSSPQMQEKDGKKELASKTFKGLEVSVLQAAEGRDGMTIFGQRQTPKKRRKSRTAFTNHQIYELEKRFLYQKYLSPADRDQIAQQLGLTNAQVITWFQNRRAKLKRDLEEMKADVESAKKLGPSGQMDIVALAELEQNSEAAGGGGGGCGRAKSRPGSPASTWPDKGDSMRVGPACPFPAPSLPFY